MDANPDPSDVPREIIEFIRDGETWQSLCGEWDGMYPGNPVAGADEDDRNEE